MNIQQREEQEFTYATVTDWDNAEASELGQLNTESAWILTDRDVWHANPYYTGLPVPHPEEETYFNSLEEENEWIISQYDSDYELVPFMSSSEFDLDLPF